ncbi:hypothetical protein DL93DRAFT_2084972 [Clavulina sp. PMI_390]|nr:hypothetical protein DL93DRAFT_2084972 [Clavulina sp. PMI_390]
MKRKEQNRAAQRAFRERKERHVKEVSPLSLSRSTHTYFASFFSPIAYPPPPA